MIEVEPGEWNALLARRGVDDVYLRREYVESACTIEPGIPTFLSEGDVDRSAFFRELDGVLQHVPEDLLQAVPVGDDRQV